MRLFTHRLAGGGTSVTAVGAQYAFVAVYNDAAFLTLRVNEFLTYSTSVGNLVAFFTRGTVGSKVSQGISIWSDGASPAGQLWSGTDTNAPPFGIIVNPFSNSGNFPPSRPWFFLRQGYSLVIKADTVNTNLSVTFWWEVLEMDMLTELDEV